MFWSMNPRQQGDLGEASAVEWLVSHGYPVWSPVGHSPDADFVIEINGELERVQVKTSTQLIKNGRYLVSLKTCGGNQSWNKIVKRFSSDRCDRLFVLIADGRRWFIPATAVQGTTGIVVGGPKYAPYEVEPGAPFSLVAAA